MAQSIKAGLVCHVQRKLRDLNSVEGLPFRHLLDEQRILAALERGGVKFRKRIYDPLTTLYAFLSQVIASKDSSCEDAVSRVIAERVARGQPACSPDNSSYCTARSRLLEGVVADLARETGQELEREAPNEWLWKGRHVKIVDGSTAEMADTPENQAEYPQSSTQKPGLGFPMLRMVVLFSLAVGTALDCAIGSCRGKKTGEQNLFRELQDALEPGDLVLGDRLYDNYRDIAVLRARGIDVVLGKNASRRADFRQGRKLGQDDHVVLWKKPRYNPERYSSREEWEALPDEMEMREIRKVVRRDGFRMRLVIIVTTLLDGDLYSAEELLDLFALRWHCELDLRSLKQALGMRRLHCKTPAMVRKELWTYFLAYNLIRVRMAQAAALHERLPRCLSFTAAKQHIHNFTPHLSTASAMQRQRLELELLQAIAASCLT
jgi:hypothetical protein